MGYIIKDGQAVQSSLILCAGVGTQVGRGSGASWNNKAKCQVCGKTVSCNSSTGRIKPHGTRRAPDQASDNTIRLDMGSRAFQELWVVEHDTAGRGASAVHVSLANAMETSTKLPNGKWRHQVTPEVLVYLAENLHYHIDRLQDMLGGVSPNYDWDTWSKLGADLASMRGLDQRVRRMCQKRGLRYRV